ncbi:MAG: 5-methyltetrahydropteroyltriglutamate--homocysteine S-methyltransferase [Candidatus Makaraimicrobium thalassicum]|nr:MAG: 5-methyltetrahydropteroyltriglutamate--homocysteine S-methyltransferase [Candidatus Omnitrophota bacterium]
MWTYAYGFPRLGKKREFKSSIEGFWSGRIGEKRLVALLDKVQRQREAAYRENVDIFPVGEFTLYDNIFDTALMLGIYRSNDLGRYFSFGRGKKALEMKKYFNTNYHYLVPHIKKGTKFRLSWNKPLLNFKNTPRNKDMPVFVVGPYTFLKLSRLEDGFAGSFEELCLVYKELFGRLKRGGAGSVHLEEPAFCGEVPAGDVRLIVRNYRKMIPAGIDVNLVTYYESVDFLEALYELPVAAIGLDFVAGADNLDILRKKGFPEDKGLICGVVDGRSVRRSDIAARVKLLRDIKEAADLDDERIMISNSAPLFHLPVSLENETKMTPKIKRLISFAEERLHELSLIKRAFEGGTAKAGKWSRNVREKPSGIIPKTFDTLSIPEKEYPKRKKVHDRELGLPLFPTTTIGSFPQDREVRKMRLDFRRKRLSASKYRDFIDSRISALVGEEDRIGLDVLVHGEFERSDMVEFFAQRLGGFVTTENGWIISYGTRVYRPPIVYDRIKRTRALTVRETTYADRITGKPVKGIFTGPVTILAWSYNLRTTPVHKAAFELASALNEEARELNRKGIKIIQIDEPAIKEYSPLKERKKEEYFRWAVRSFNLTSRLPEKIQVHTHLCYSEFGEIMKWILKMNFDVITIETAREKGKVLDTFARAGFKRGIGPGLWDIHSRYPAEEKTIRTILDKSIKLFGPENIWINPDCGLKTRGWEEVEASLGKLVKAAGQYRKQFAGSPDIS